MAVEGEYVVKLVRDRIGETVGPPRDFYYRPTDDHEQHVKLLRQKLGEEVIEYLLDPSVGELADVQEAVDCLAALCHGGIAGLQTAATAKRGERGSFIDGMVMVARSTEDSTDG